MFAAGGTWVQYATLSNIHSDLNPSSAKMVVQYYIGSAGHSAFFRNARVY